jgi:serine/threonine protein kinase
MPAHATTVSEYCAILTRSKLVPEAEVQALLRTWNQQGNGTEADVDSFRKHLVSKKTLTEYQAALIQRGRADGFFVGGYVILDRIGRGQSAGVYKAVHPSGQVVALKVLPASKAKDPAVLGRFQREGRLLTQLDHPNVVRAFQVGQSGGVWYIVMEHLDGETLDEVLARRGRLSAVEAVRVVYQAVRGLEHLHEQKMVHRDLKPSNLMVTPPRLPGEPDSTLGSTIKILDIGIGRELFDEDSSDTRNEMLTTEGAILGTPDYLAPEQARDARSADIRADLYSLGCVLYHLIAGRPPFEDKTVMALVVKHATENPPSLRTAAPDVPTGLEAV